MRELDVDLGGPVHYVDHGGEGTPLVLLHGLGGSRLNWMAVAPGLARRHRVYALEYIGHGLTPAAGRKANLSGHRLVIDRFLEKVVGEPATLVGNSTGGHLAVMEAALRPERVRGLVLVDPAVPIPPGHLALPRVAALALAPLMVRGVGEALMMANAGRISSEQQVYRTLKLVSADASRIPADVVQAHLEAHRPRHGDRASNAAFLQTGRSLFLHNLRRSAFYAQARKVRCPVLVVQGSHDRLVPMGAIRRLLQVRPDWQLHVFEGVGHVPMMEVPDQFNEVVLGWLAERDRAAA